MRRDDDGRPLSPGEVLYEDFLVPNRLSPSAFAQQLGVPVNRITRLIHGEHSVTVDTAFMLARALGTTPEFWLDLNTRHEVHIRKMMSPTSLQSCTIRQ
jgi:addiction module HigA family antidote